MNIYYNIYDVIICGSSIIHDLLASLFTSEGKSVFYFDRNRYYGGEGRSVDQLSDLWKLFHPDKKFPDHLKGFMDKGVDLLPKLLQSNGKFAQTKIQKYLTLKCIDENLICYHDKNQEKIIQDYELLNEGQKNNYFKFIEYLTNYDNHKLQQEFDLKEISFRDLAKEFKLDEQSVELLGKVSAFQLNDDYLNKPAYSTVEKIKLQLGSKNYLIQKPEYYLFNTVFSKNNNHIKGGLGIDIQEILFDDKGQVQGIVSDYCKIKNFGGSPKIYAPIIIADSSYANYKLIKQQNRINQIGKIIRCICILNHTLPGYDNKSLSITIPKSQTGRKNDIYITLIPKEMNYDDEEYIYYICVISTNIETNDPEAELEQGLKVINPVLEKFITISHEYVQNEWKNNLYFTNSYNASNILDTEIEQVFEIYKYITGKTLDLNNQQDLVLKDNKNYDVIICGTSIMHGILASLLTKEGKRVFYADRNEYYGGEGRTLIGISDVWEFFRSGQQHRQKELDAFSKFDLIPKLILSNGKLINILATTKVLDYLKMQYVDENLIYLNDQNQERIIKVYIQTQKKIPSSQTNIQDIEFITEDQRINFLKFIEYVVNYDDLNFQQEFDLNQISFRDLVKEFRLDQQSVELIGKVLAFYLNEDYLNQPARSTVEKIKLYLLSKNNINRSPFIYPLGGIGYLLEMFNRSLHHQKCDIKLFTEVKEILFDEKGLVSGIKFSGHDQINAPIIIADPSYAKDINQNRINSVGKIIRCICLLNHTILGYDEKSLSLIIPKSQTGRKNDIYITILGYSHIISEDQAHYVCVISTNIETNDPEQEIEAALNVINPVLEKFITISDYYVQNEWKNNLYFTNSQNASNVLDTELEQVLEIYKQIIGKNLDSIKKDWTYQ